MAQLLISIANEKEANVLRHVLENMEAEHASNPVGIVDFKDPGRGALGFVGVQSARSISRSLGLSFGSDLVSAPCGGIVKSIALGEMNDYLVGRSVEVPSEIIEWLGHQSSDSDFRFAKVGLAGMSQVKDWQSLWSDLMRSFSDSMQPVGVAYLDAENCDGPRIEEVLEVCVDCEAALLLDTFDKSSGDAISVVGFEKLKRIVSLARAKSVLTVVAGSVKEKQLREVKSLGADFVGVRGAVCVRDRSQLDATRLTRFLKAFQA